MNFYAGNKNGKTQNAARKIHMFIPDVTQQWFSQSITTTLNPSTSHIFCSDTISKFPHDFCGI